MYYSKCLSHWVWAYTDAWAAAVGAAILDEAQKEPAVCDKVKYAFDAGQITRSVLLGSSQIMMLQKVRETLAGRAFIYELWPLLASELVSQASSPPAPPLLDHLLVEPGTADEIFTAVPNILVGEAANQSAAAIEHLLTWGGMPALLHPSAIKSGVNGCNPMTPPTWNVTWAIWPSCAT